MFKPLRLYPLNPAGILTIFVVILLCTTLVQSEVFIFPWLASYYLYIAFASIFITMAGVLLFKRELPKQLSFPIPVLIFTLWAFYILLHGKFIDNGLILRHILLITTCCLFIALFFVISIGLVHIQTIFKAIAALATFESIVCIIQYLGLTHSENGYFTVTGSWQNPNITAMFLVLAVPAFVPYLSSQKAIIRKAIPLILTLIAIALILLKCRTAYLGLGILLVILLNSRYELLKRTRRNQKASILTIAILLSVIVPLGNYLYQAKKSSADGRKLIWKLSMNMVTEKPLSGYGYGFFERNYNLNQAKYIREGKVTPKELEIAGFVRMGYNEFLESAVEGGIIGLIIFLGLIVSLLIAPGKMYKVRDDAPFVHSVYMGVAAFSGMSLVNFSLRSIPLILIFVLYSAILCSDLAKNKTTKWLLVVPANVSSGLKNLVAICLVLSALLIFVSQYPLPLANYKNKVALNMAKQKQFKSAIKVLDEIKTIIPDHDSFLKNYGTILLATGDYRQAIAYFNKAKIYTSDPDLYVFSGQCYYKSQRFESAIKEFEMASLLEPQRFLPRVALMNLYYKMNDTLGATTVAYGILQLKAKIPSSKITGYKESARNLLNKFNYPL